MKSSTWMKCCCVLIAVTIGVGAAEVVRIGAGSYLDALPEGAKGPPAEIFKTADFKGPMPTNDWWSSLAWVPLSDVMYPHPLALRAVEGGLRVYYPGANITANQAAIFGFMPGGGDDFILGHSGVEKFKEARVAGFSDWFVTAQMGDVARGMRLTFGHGSPFVFAEFSGGEPVLTFPKAPEVFAGSEKEAVLGVKMGKRLYAFFAPSGSTWSGIGSAKISAKTNGKNYFALAVLPDDKPETLTVFKKCAYAHVTDSKVAWSYDEATGAVKTTFSVTAKPKEGDEKETLLALYPHQWRATNATLTGHVYPSVRGPMKLFAGNEFSTEMKLPAVLPSLPLTNGADRAKLKEYLAADLSDKPKLVADTYWLGKQLGKWATLLPIAEQAGDTAAVAACDERLRGALENFLSATDAKGAPKGRSAGAFAYEKNWGTLIGFPSSYDSDTQLNDHHFHYGYFLRAAGEVARRDPEWASDAKWGGMLKLLVREIANPDRADPLFPFLRCIDPYAGHSWASGHAKFADGNNNESSSEAVNAWYGVLMLGEALNDRALRDLGAWLLTTEISAIEDYWFDVRGDLRPAEYPASVVTMVWGGKGANGTWFSAKPENIHGINWLPVSGASLYLGRWPEYAKKNYDALIREKNGAAFEQWQDIIWMYRAFSDSRDALKQWDARPANFKPEGGNSFANTYVWLTTIDAYGVPDRSIISNAPFAVAFNKDGRRTCVAWNFSKMARTVTFSDGTKVECPAKTFGVK